MTLDDLLDRTAPIPDTGCMLWTGRLNHRGYGVIDIAGKELRAHRLAKALSGRPLAPNEIGRHTCDTRACINPVHIVPGSQAENVRDMVERGRHRPVQVRFSPQKIVGLRAAVARRSALGESISSIARALHVSRRTIARLVRVVA